MKARCEVKEDCARHRTQTFLIRLVMKNYSLKSYLKKKKELLELLEYISATKYKKKFFTVKATF